MVRPGWRNKIMKKPEKKLIKKLILAFLLLFTFSSFASVLDESIKIYPKPADSLFLTVLDVLSGSKYKISEIQSKNGYILFLDDSTYYLLTVTKRYQNQSEIKILPQNSNFSKGSDVAKSIFLLIDEGIKTPLELVK